MLRSIRLDANGDAKPVRHVTGEFCIEHLIWHREYAAVQQLLHNQIRPNAQLLGEYFNRYIRRPKW